MGTYIIRRLLQSIPMLLLASIVLFVFVTLAPGGSPLAFVLGNNFITQRSVGDRRGYHYQ